MTTTPQPPSSTQTQSSQYGGQDMVQISPMMPQAATSTPRSQPSNPRVSTAQDSQQSAESSSFSDHVLSGKLPSDIPSSPKSPTRPARIAVVQQSHRSPIPPSPNLSDPNSYPGSPRSPLYDVERQQKSRPSRPSRPESSSSILDDSYCLRRDDEADEVFLESKALKILIYLSGFEGFVSLLIAFWTLFSLFVVTMLSPLHLCSRRTSFRDDIISFLSPALKIQLSMIYSSRRSNTYNTTLLVFIHLLSPLVSVGVALAAWTAAVFWFYAAIIGDPNGSDRPEGYNDGKASVLAVRAWWETWLTRALR